MGHRGFIVLRYRNLYLGAYHHWCNFTNRFGKQFLSELVNILRNEEMDILQMKLIDAYLRIEHVKNANYFNLINELLINVFTEKIPTQQTSIRDVIGIIVDYTKPNELPPIPIPSQETDEPKILIDIDNAIRHVFNPPAPPADSGWNNVYEPCGMTENEWIIQNYYENTKAALKEYTNDGNENIYIIDFDKDKVIILANGIWGPRDLMIDLKKENIGILEKHQQIIYKLNCEWQYDEDEYDLNATHDEIHDLLQENNWVMDPEINDKIHTNGPFAISIECSRQEIRQKIQSNDIFKDIKTSGKSRTNEAIINDINNKINAYHDGNQFLTINTEWKYINPILFCQISSEMANEYQQIYVKDENNVFIYVPRNYEKRDVYDKCTQCEKVLKAQNEYIEKVAWFIDNDM